MLSLFFFFQVMLVNQSILVSIKIKMKLFTLILKIRKKNSPLLLGRYVQMAKPQSHLQRVMPCSYQGNRVWSSALLLLYLASVRAYLHKIGRNVDLCFSLPRVILLL